MKLGEEYLVIVPVVVGKIKISQVDKHREVPVGGYLQVDIKTTFTQIDREYLPAELRLPEEVYGEQVQEET
jgi:hypothetical protein